MTTKEYVLNKLEQNKGEYITGMSLANELGVSRNAVWKAVSDLKKDGYNIYSVNNRGYSLDETSDILSVSAITKCMEGAKKEDIKRLAESIVIYDELESTNRTAKLSLITGESDKRIIIARTQTAGVGHNKKRFDSPEGGIYMSLILKEMNPDIGECVKGILEELTGKKATLDKTYNRIYIGKKNVCGILTEYFADYETNTVSEYIVGIGIKNLSVSKNEIIAKILTANVNLF